MRLRRALLLSTLISSVASGNWINHRSSGPIAKAVPLGIYRNHQGVGCLNHISLSITSSRGTCSLKANRPSLGQSFHLMHRDCFRNSGRGDFTPRSMLEWSLLITRITRSSISVYLASMQGMLWMGFNSKFKFSLGAELYPQQQKAQLNKFWQRKWGVLSRDDYRQSREQAAKNWATVPS